MANDHPKYRSLLYMWCQCWWLLSQSAGSGNGLWSNWYRFIAIKITYRHRDPRVPLTVIHVQYYHIKFLNFGIYEQYTATFFTVSNWNKVFFLFVLSAQAIEIQVNICMGESFHRILWWTFSVKNSTVIWYMKYPSRSEWIKVKSYLISHVKTVFLRTTLIFTVKS